MIAILQSFEIEFYILIEQDVEWQNLKKCQQLEGKEILQSQVGVASILGLENDKVPEYQCEIFVFVHQIMVRI